MAHRTNLSVVLICLGMAFTGVSIPMWADENSLISKTFDVPRNYFTIDSAELIDEKKQTYDVRQQLMMAGVRFPPGRSALYTRATQKLVVVNAREYLAMIDQLWMRDR